MVIRGIDPHEGDEDEVTIAPERGLLGRRCEVAQNAALQPERFGQLIEGRIGSATGDVDPEELPLGQVFGDAGSEAELPVAAFGVEQTDVRFRPAGAGLAAWQFVLIRTIGRSSRRLVGLRPGSWRLLANTVVGRSTRAASGRPSPGLSGRLPGPPIGRLTSVPPAGPRPPRQRNARMTAAAIAANAIAYSMIRIDRSSRPSRGGGAEEGSDLLAISSSVGSGRRRHGSAECGAGCAQNCAPRIPTASGRRTSSYHSSLTTGSAGRGLRGLGRSGGSAHAVELTGLINFERGW